ncbi:MAG: alpha/beta hydrolase [Proteobacteria bacterium]|nr:alpha/beta hydrolase [Pseudomonadota bacterium]
MWLLAGGACLAAVQCLAEGLPRSVAEARRLERESALSAPASYAQPRALSRSRPGELLAQEAYGGYLLPPGSRAWRIVYHSLDAEGRAVASSAFVVVPAGQTPPDGWPVIAWAHGTSGVARRCAPSLMADLYYGDLGLLDMVRAGYALVAPDYHGLGTPGRHQYISKIAQARDVIYAVPAARQAVPELGVRWVVDGHSQGGLAAWSVAEMESSRRDPGYLGAVSVAGAAKPEELLRHLGDTPGVGFYLAFMAFGVQARFPSFSPADMLTPAAMARYPAATSDGCWYHGYALFADLDSQAILKSGWDRNPWVRRFFAENELGRVAVAGPLLVLAGEADASVPIEGVRETVARACRAGSSRLRFRSYPGLDHDPTMLKTVGDQLAWIGDRFAGAAAPNDCAAP